MAEHPSNSRDRSGVWIDYDTGIIHAPDKKTRPLVGKTSGTALKELQADDQKARLQKLRMERQLRSVWGCTQCKRLFSPLSPNPLRNILKQSPRVKTYDQDGFPEVLACFDQKCDAPIVIVEDALSLRSAPGGRV